MRTKSRLSRAIEAVEQHGVLLVYPVKDKRDPLSLWHVFYPRSEMKWAWDDAADPRVAELWHLRAALAESKRVVYSKWLGGRATLFSQSLFRAMLAALRAKGSPVPGLGRSSRALYEILLDDSPQGTSALRANAGLEGRLHEADFTASMRALWSRLLIVGVGEREEGGYPSLAVGATELLFETLWNDAGSLRVEDTTLLERTLANKPAFARAWRRISATIAD
jgi:hypothetical protein